MVTQTDPSAGICWALLSMTIIAPGLVYIGIWSLGSGSLCQLNVDLGSFNRSLTLPNLYFLVNSS